MIGCSGHVIMHSKKLNRNTQAVLSAESYSHLFLRVGKFVEISASVHLFKIIVNSENDYVEATNSTSIAHK